MMKKSVCMALTIAVSMVSCAPKKEPIPPMPEMKTSGKMVVYQMMTRLFGNQVTTNKPYGTLEENGVGKFKDINDKALQALKELGTTHIWYTGILEHAVLTDYTKYGIPLDDADVVKGRAGSPYAIKDYYDVNPDLAVDVPNRIKEFEQLVERTHANGLKVIIDFVPNHVARAYKSDAKPPGVRDLGEDDDKTVRFKTNNNFYYIVGESFQVPKDFVSLGLDNSFPTKDGRFQESPAKVSANGTLTSSPGLYDWFDVIKLNYGVDVFDSNKNHFEPVPDTWVKMKDILVYWANKKVDGFRCDMAEMVPVEFWGWVIPQVKAVNADVIFIAEIYNPTQYRNYIQTGHFDFLYDKVQLYDTLRDLTGGRKSTRDIEMIQKSLEGINSRMLHFMENHDEHRIASPSFAGNPTKTVPAMVISATIDNGPVMIYFGQEVGEPAAGDPGFQNIENKGVTTKMDYWGVPELQKWVNGGAFDGGLLSAEQKNLRQFYATLLNLAQKSPAITQGSYHDITDENIAAGNFNESVHVFIRATSNEKLLVVSNFGSKAQHVKINIPTEVAGSLALAADEITATEILWGAIHGKMNNYQLEVDLPASGAFIFKLH